MRSASARRPRCSLWGGLVRASQGWPLAYQGQTSAAETVIERAIEAFGEIGGLQLGYAHWGQALAALAAGDGERAELADGLASPLMNLQPDAAKTIWFLTAETALARGDLNEARRRADEAVAATTDRPAYAAMALMTRTRVAIAEGRPELAEDCAHRALIQSIAVESYLGVPDILECLAGLAGTAGSHTEAARLFGAADAVRQRLGIVRFKIYDCEYNAAVAMLREGLEETAFEAAWAEGATLSGDEAIAYAQRGRGERKRPSSEWASLTPTELDVVRLVSEGLANKEIAARLFISTRTVQTHLTHVYAKLGLTSRVQLAQQATRQPRSAIGGQTRDCG